MKTITRKPKPTFVCSRCKKTIDVSHTLEPNYCGGSGYAIKFSTSGKTKHKVCYACYAETDSKFMDKHGEITLYLVSGDSGTVFKITNWPGTLVFTSNIYTVSRNNWGAKRTDVWFRRMNANGQWEKWHGVHVGFSHQLIKCKRCKS
jgi:hypothetical protein